MAYADSIRTNAATFEATANLIDALNSSISTINSTLAPFSGWTDISETWTWASSTTITVPTDATTRFQKGDKIWCTNSGTKYFYVVGVAATTLTVSGGSDYSVANAAISSIKMSRYPHPFGFPTQFNWVPTFTGFSANPTSVVATFYIHQGRCFASLRCGANGTSNATTFTVTNAPVAVASGTHGIACFDAADNSATLTTPARAFISSGTTITFNKDMATGAWTNANGKGASFTNLSWII